MAYNAVVVTVSSFKASLSASPATVIAGNNVVLQSNANEDYSVIAWKPTVFFSNTNKTQTITVSDSSKTFEVIAESLTGCRDTASIKITVKDNEGDIFIPNAFTLNNDGKNGIFKVFGSSVKSVDMRIYT